MDDSRERELLTNYVNARKKEERLDAEKSAAYKEMKEAESRLITFLDDMGKKSTGTYPDLGSVLKTDPIMNAKVSEENKAKQFEYLKETGAAAVIKETVNYQTFGALIRERSEKGESIPDFVEITYVPQIKYSKPK